LENSKFLRRFVFMGVFVFAAVMVAGFGAKEKQTAQTDATEPVYLRDRHGLAAPPRERAAAGTKTPELVRVTGRVRMVGSGPHTELVITGDQGEWHTEPRDRNKLINLQQRTVTVEGKLDSRDMILPSGKSLGTWLILRNITVISSE
jgi:hypothetical protein